MGNKIVTQGQPQWEITDLEMVDILKGDQVVGKVPTAYFQVRYIPSQSWVHDNDLGLIEMMPDKDGLRFKVTGFKPTELIEQCDEVQRIMDDIDKTFLDVEIEQWYYYPRTCSFTLEGFGTIH